VNPLTLSLFCRNDRLNVIRDAIDGGMAAGRLVLYAGPRPTLGNILTNNPALAQFIFPRPCAPNAVNGTLTFAPIAPTTAIVTGDATWARATDSAGNVVFDCDVGTNGTPIILNATRLLTGGQVTITSAAISEGNA
jgi:hypothetical protein